MKTLPPCAACGGRILVQPTITDTQGEPPFEAKCLQCGRDIAGTRPDPHPDLEPGHRISHGGRHDGVVAAVAREVRSHDAIATSLLSARGNAR